MWMGYKNTRMWELRHLPKKAAVLLSTDFRYLGREGNDDYQAAYPVIRSLLDHLTQGHRVNHSPTVYAELKHLKAVIWKQYRVKRVGKPFHDDPKRVYNSGTGATIIGCT